MTFPSKLIRAFEEGRMKTNEILSNGSRRTFLQLSAAATAAMAFRIATEASLAAEDRKVFHPGAVVIDANENPLGPCDAARKAIVDMAPQGGRYSYWLKEEFEKTFAEMEGLKPEYLGVFPGSSEPLHSSVLAVTWPKRSQVHPDQSDQPDDPALRHRTATRGEAERFRRACRRSLHPFFRRRFRHRSGEGRSRRDCVAHLLENLRNGRYPLRNGHRASRLAREAGELQRLERHADHRCGRRNRQPEARASRLGAQTVERRDPPKNI